MKYLSKRFASILLSFTFFAASIILYVNFINPTYANIKIEQGKLAAAQQKNTEYTSVFTRLKQVSSAVQQAPELQNRVSMAFPLESNVADSMNQISAIALANGLNITSIDITGAPIIPTASGKVVASSLVKGVSVLKNTVRLNGTYPQLKGFLQGIETGVRIASIRSVKIDKTANLPDVVSIALEIETYYQTK